MPHEILNLLTIRTESEEEFKRIKEYCASNELPLDFQKIFPIPHPVICCNGKHSSYVHNWCVKAWGTDTQPWDIEVWNSRTKPLFTKWCESDVGVGYTFSTTRCPPVGIIRELSRKFPSAWFSLRANDRDNPALPTDEWYHWGMEDFWGEKCDNLLIKNGEILNNLQQLKKLYDNFSGFHLLTNKTIYL